MTEEAPDTSKKMTLDDIPWYAVPAVLLGVPALLAVLSLIWPQVFFDRFVDPYYWTPIRTDGGYNAVNTATWAVLLGLCLVGLTQLVTALKVKMDDTFIYGAVAWVVTGAIFRVMEDTNMFIAPLKYVMITPPIYLLFAVFAAIALLIGKFVHSVAEAKGVEAALQKLWLIQSAFVLFYTLLWAMDWSQITQYLNPVIVALLAALNFFAVRARVLKVGEVRPSEMMLGLAIAPFLMALAYVVQFIAEPWAINPRIFGISSSFVTVPLLAIGLSGTAIAVTRAGHLGQTKDYRIVVAFAAFFAVMLGIVVWTAPTPKATEFNTASILSIAGLGVFLAIVGVLIAKRLHKKETPAEKLTPFMIPLNIFLVISQVMDGFATSLGLDLSNYGEKHVLSKYIIDAFRDLSTTVGWEFGAAYPTFLAFVPLKLAIAMGVVYAIDVYSKEDVQNHPTMIGFVKFAIIMVGIGPAVRDFVRLSLGI